MRSSRDRAGRGLAVTARGVALTARGIAFVLLCLVLSACVAHRPAPRSEASPAAPPVAVTARVELVPLDLSPDGEARLLVRMRYRDAGGAIVHGGQVEAPQRRAQLTVIVDPDPSAELMREEIFGPVLPILSYRALDEALGAINARPKPLALYVFGNAAVAERTIERTSAGGTLVNDTLLHFAHPNLPVGGVGDSGMGNYHGHFGFKAFSHERAVMRQSKATLAPMLAPPYTRTTRSILALLERLS